MWDNWTFEKPNDFKPVSNLLKLLKAKGRLILGFYETLIENNHRRINNLKSAGYNPDGLLENSPRGEIICWFDK